MDNEPISLPMTEREDRLRLIIQHSLSESIQKNLTNLVTVPTCKIIHENLEKERKQRGEDIETRRKEDNEWKAKIEEKFNSFFIAVIITLGSSLGALILAGINFFTAGKVK
jgi:hypothetical protein